MAELDLETARWLTSADGRAAVTTATRQLDEGATELAVAAGLQRLSAHAERRAAALEAATARRRARGRWPDADELLLTREALEQASDPVVADHRAGRLLAALRAGSGTTDTVVDLCAGIGGDTIALARIVSEQDVQVVAVDIDASRLLLLAHNAEVAGVHVATRRADALTVELPSGSVLHTDPSRRRDGRRIRRLREHEPSVPALFAAHPDASLWAVALAPGVDVEDRDLPEGIEVEYTQLGGALLEATVWTGPGHPVPGPDGQRRASATLLGDDGSVVTRGHVPAWRVRLPVGGIGRVLIEVAPSAVRARLHDTIGRELGARRIAQHRALLTADAPPATSPWYRARPVLAELSPRPRAVRRWLQDHELATGTPPTVEVVLHGVMADPEALWRDIGRPRRGPHGLRLEFIRRDHDSVTVVTDGSGRGVTDGSGHGVTDGSGRT